MPKIINIYYKLEKNVLIRRKYFIWKWVNFLYKSYIETSGIWILICFTCKCAENRLDASAFSEICLCLLTPFNVTHKIKFRTVEMFHFFDFFSFIAQIRLKLSKKALKLKQNSYNSLYGIWWRQQLLQLLILCEYKGRKSIFCKLNYTRLSLCSSFYSFYNFHFELFVENSLPCRSIKDDTSS